MGRLAVLVGVALALAACAPSEATGISAAAPFTYQAPVDATIERLAVVITVAHRTEDDLLVDPALFALRDREGRLYSANVPAAAADARLVRQAGTSLGLAGLLPLPALTLRKDDSLTGFIVFDVPLHTRPVELIFRQTDTDQVVPLPEPPLQR